MSLTVLPRSLPDTTPGAWPAAPEHRERTLHTRGSRGGQDEDRL